MLHLVIQTIKYARNAIVLGVSLQLVVVAFFFFYLHDTELKPEEIDHGFVSFLIFWNAGLPMFVATLKITQSYKKIRIFMLLPFSAVQIAQFQLYCMLLIYIVFIALWMFLLKAFSIPFVHEHLAEIVFMHGFWIGTLFLGMAIGGIFGIWENLGERLRKYKVLVYIGLLFLLFPKLITVTVGIPMYDSPIRILMDTIQEYKNTMNGVLSINLILAFCAGIFMVSFRYKKSYLD